VQLSDPKARLGAVEQLLSGEIIATAFNGIFALVGDADDPRVPRKLAAAKGRPRAKGVALICPPESLREHVAQSDHPLATVEALYRSVHAVGLILPAAEPGAPRLAVQAQTILNVWTEERPRSHLRELVLELRRRGRRALVGTSANVTGRPTISDPAESEAVFGDRVAAMLLDSFDHVPPERRRSASIVDLTAAPPRLVREGSVPAGELRAAMRAVGLAELTVPLDVARV